MKDQLEMFCDWFLANVPFGAMPLHGCVRNIGPVMAVELWKNAPYQVQMFVVPPTFIIPEHTHPNVDSIEVYLGGQIRFSHAGRFVVNEAQLVEPREGTPVPQLRFNRIRVRPADVHGGVFGASGGVFLSVQRWADGVEPSCVSVDYDGIAMSDEHAKTVTHRAVIEPLSAKSAASLEFA